MQLLGEGEEATTSASYFQPEMLSERLVGEGIVETT